MTDTKIKTNGQCLCGGVQITVEQCDVHVGACHCDMCRKWVGGPFMAVDCGQNVTFEGEDNITRFESSEWAQRGFCKQCGTSLFYYLKPASQYIMAAGLFNAEKDYHFDHEIFIDEQPTYYRFANETKKMTGEEVFASAGE